MNFELIRNVIDYINMEGEGGGIYCIKYGLFIVCYLLAAGK